MRRSLGSLGSPAQPRQVQCLMMMNPISRYLLPYRPEGGWARATATPTVLRWPPIIHETRAVAGVIGAIGFGLWWTKKLHGLGENLLAVAIVVFVVDGMKRLRDWMIRREWGRKVLVKTGSGNKRVPSAGSLGSHVHNR